MCMSQGNMLVCDLCACHSFLPALLAGQQPLVGTQGLPWLLWWWPFAS